MIRAVDTRDELELCLRIVREVEQVGPTIDDLEAVREQLLLHPDGGYAPVKPSSVAGSAYAMVRVLLDRRGSGIGSALVEAAKAEARRLGTGSAWGVIHAGDEESLRFATNRGFVEVGREVELRRRLAVGEGTVDSGIVELREEHRAGAYAVSVEAIRDMPTAGAPEARPFDAWIANELAGVVAFVALEGEKVVGYATLERIGD